MEGFMNLIMCTCFPISITPTLLCHGIVMHKFNAGLEVTGQQCNFKQNKNRSEGRGHIMITLMNEPSAASVHNNGIQISRALLTNALDAHESKQTLFQQGESCNWYFSVWSVLHKNQRRCSQYLNTGQPSNPKVACTSKQLLYFQEPFST